MKWYKVIRALVVWTRGKVVYGSPGGRWILDAELRSLSFILKAVWKMGNEQVN